MKRAATIAFTLLALATLGAGSYFYLGKGGSKPPAERYRIDTVERGELVQSVSANGTLNPVSVISVGTQVSGTVKALHVDFNDRVKAGQLLLELDDSLLSAQTRQSAASVQSALASLELAAANENRLRTLFEQSYVSRQELEQAIQARKSAAAQVEQAKAQGERDRANLSYTRIRSPVDGVVVDRVVDVGQTVAASFQTPTLIKIARDLSQMQIDSSFAEADIGAIRVGQPVRFNVDAFPNKSFRGEVRQIRLNPTTQQNVVTYNVVISVANPEETLLPGMTAYVSIAVARRENALLVPNAALRFRPAEAATPAEGDKKGRKRDAASGTVYVLAGDEIRAVPVSLGISDQRRTEILSGELQPGNQVVVGDALAANGAPQGGPGSPVRMRLF